MNCRGRNIFSSEIIELEFDGAIAHADPVLAGAMDTSDTWLAPGFIDLQVNGFAGADYNRPATTLESIASSLGAIFQTSIRHSLSNSLAAAHLTSNQLTQASAAISGGQTALFIKSAPVAYQGMVTSVSHQAFIRGFNLLDTIAAIIALSGALFAFILIRKRDMAVYDH